MNPALLDPARIAASHSLRDTSLRIAAMIVFGSTLAGALLFRTYGLEVSPLGWEMVRHFNILFMVCEVAVFGIAVGAGLNLRQAFSSLSRSDKLALTVWLSTFWIGSLFSQQPQYSLITVVSWPIHILFGLSIWHLARQGCEPVENMARSAVASAAIVLAVLLAMTVVHFSLAPDPALIPGGKVFWAGAIPGFMSVRMFGVVMAYAALLGAGVLLAARDQRRVELPAALLVVGVAAMCWSSTRAAFVAYLASLVLVPIIGGHRPIRRVKLMVAVCSVSGMALSLAIPAPDSAYGLLAMFGVGEAGSGELTTGRLEIWRTALGAIAERPLFGSGEGATRWLVDPQMSGHVQPHNLFLQLPLHWGAIATGAALWLAGRMAFGLIAAVRADRAMLPFAMIVAASLVAALFDGALYYPQMVMLPVAALAFALARRPEAKAATAT